VTELTGSDLRAVAALVGHHADRTVLGTTQQLHRAIAGRVFRYVPGSAPVRIAHDAIADGVYGCVRVAIRGAAAAGELAATVTSGGRPVRWFATGRGRSTTLSIVHGVLGDRFADEHPELELPVRIRHEGRDLEPTTGGLRHAFPAASRRVAVFVHGLTESDTSWEAPRRRARRPSEAAAHATERVVEVASGDDPTGPVEDADVVVLPDVVAELGWTPVRLRYGTGRPIARNGAELAALLEALVDEWPTDVDELTLVGHSMGGLVIRSACLVGRAAGHDWPDRVRHTVSLGTPHLGSWLERTAVHGGDLLRLVPEGAVFADVIDERSQGIKDLRYGTLTDDGDALRDPPLLDAATHHLIAGRLTRSPRHPVTRVFGDLLVTVPSATGRGRRRQLRGGRIEVLELPAGHFRLMRDPLVGDHLRHWLA
jgi:pimeloyl-ACP methyl ester carboxylesterase